MVINTVHTQPTFDALITEMNLTESVSWLDHENLDASITETKSTAQYNQLWHVIMHACIEYLINYTMDDYTIIIPQNHTGQINKLLLGM